MYLREIDAVLSTNTSGIDFSFYVNVGEGPG